MKMWDGLAKYYCANFWYWIQVSHGLGLQKTLSFLFDVQGNSQQALKDKGVIDSGCSRHMTGNIYYLSDFKEINEGYVAFGGNQKGGKITGKGKIKTGKLDFNDVYFVKELKFNLFSVSQMCDKKFSVLFIDTECVVLSSDFKLPDENHVLLRVPRENNMYNVDLKKIFPLGDLTCLFSNATLDESNLWHRRLGHINFKTMNKLVKGNLIRGLPSKVFENNHTCVACKKGKQHRVSCKTKPVSSVSQPLQRIKREFSVARTPQQNGVAERKNRTLIEAARTMLADLLLPIPFWAEAVNTSCHVQNRVLVTKPHNKTPYELLLGRTPSIGFMRSFGCPVTILNTLDPLRMFNGKADEGFLVGYSVSSKAFRVFNSRTRIVQDTLHINFLKNQPNVVENGPTWLFDIDTLTHSMNYQPIVTGNQPNHKAGIQGNFDADPQNIDADATFDDKENEFAVHVSPSSSDKIKKHNEKAKREAKGKSPSDTAVSTNFEIGGKSSFMNPSQYPDDPDMPALEDIIYSDDEEDVGAETDFSNLETSITISPIPTTKVYKDHPVTQIIGDLSSAPQTRSMTRMGHTQEEGIDYEDVFAPVPKIEAIRLFLAYASFMGFMVYQMDVKSDFLYGTIKEEVYVCQPPGFEDPDYPDKVYKVVKALYGLHQAPRACQDKYVAEILRKFRLTDGKSASTPIDTKKPLLKDPDGCRLIYWQCKKKTVVATSSTEAEYVAAASCCAQVLWTQNQLLDYGMILELVEQGPLIWPSVEVEGVTRLKKYSELSAAEAIQADCDKVANLEQEKIAQALEITKLKQRVGKLEQKRKFKSSGLKRLKKVEVVTTAAPITTVAQVPKGTAPRRRRGVVTQDPEKTTSASIIVHSEVQSKDKGKGILIEEPKPLKGQAQIDMDEAFARQLEAELNANINWNDVIEQVKRSEKQDNTVMRNQALRKKIPLFEKHYHSNQAFLERVEEEVTVQEKEIKEEGNKRIGKNLELKIAKKQRMDEETDEHKRHQKIVANDDDDLYIEAIPLALKVPIVDYQIRHENNKPYYTIIRADETYKLFLSFITLFKNFDREDLETL
nr:ribonuclease H-like domain-containing protein [Tanacetum cinerariifolium]